MVTESDRQAPMAHDPASPCSEHEADRRMLMPLNDSGFAGGLTAHQGDKLTQEAAGTGASHQLPHSDDADASPMPGWRETPERRVLRDVSAVSGKKATKTALARARIRRTPSRKPVSAAGEESAHIERLGDRIEFLEFALHDYVERLDALALEATRSSTQRLEPAVERLTEALAAGRRLTDGTDLKAENIFSDDLASRLDGIEERLDAIFRKLGPPHYDSIDTGTPNKIDGLIAAVMTLSRRHDQLRDTLHQRLARIEQTVEDVRSRSTSDEPDDRIAGIRTTIAEAHADLLANLRGREDGFRTAFDAFRKELASSLSKFTPDEAGRSTLLGIADTLARVERNLQMLPASRESNCGHAHSDLIAEHDGTEPSVPTQGNDRCAAETTDVVGRHDSARNRMPVPDDTDFRYRQVRYALAELLADAERRHILSRQSDAES